MWKWFILFGLTLVSPVGKVDCSFETNLEIDRRLLQLRKELKTDDTLILYRHLSYQYDLAAYAKVIWKKEDGLYTKRLSKKNGNHELEEFGWVKQRGPDIPLIFFNSIGTSKEDSDTLGWIISHDDLHTVHVYAQDSLIYCDIVTEDPYFENRDLPRMQFIGSLRDRSPFIALKLNADTGYGLGPKYFLDGKPVFDEDPKKNIELKKQYKRSKRKSKIKSEK